jgi:hypothetical protein
VRPVGLCTVCRVWGSRTDDRNERRHVLNTQAHQQEQATCHADSSRKGRSTSSIVRCLAPPFLSASVRWHRRRDGRPPGPVRHKGEVVVVWRTCGLSTVAVAVARTCKGVGGASQRAGENQTVMSEGCMRVRCARTTNTNIPPFDSGIE